MSSRPAPAFEDGADELDAFDKLSNDDQAWYQADVVQALGDAPPAPASGRTESAARNEAHAEPRLISTCEYLVRPAPEWLVENLLMERGLTVLVGHGGVGKTFLALDIAVCLSLGRTWFGHETTKTRVVVASLETDVQQRIRALKDQHGVDDFQDIAWLDGGINLRHPADRRDVVSAAREFGAGLFLLDPLARSISSMKENTSEDMGLAVEFADELRRDARAGLAVVHHTPWKDDHPRGHSSLFDAADIVLSVTAENSGIRTLTVTKQRNGLLGHPIRFRVEAHPGTGSAVVVPLSSKDQLDQLTGNEQRLVQVLVQHADNLPARHGTLMALARDDLRMGPSSFNTALSSIGAKGIFAKVGDSRNALYDWGEEWNAERAQSHAGSLVQSGPNLVQ